MTLGLLLLLFADWAATDVRDVLLRVSEEAEAFRHLAPQTLSQETLRQRAAVARRQFRPRIGSGALRPPEFQYLSRQIISEYGFSSFKESPDTLHEFRQVVSVDGKPVKAPEAARRTLTLGIRSPDDHVKKRMLDEFARHGLADAVTDFGQLLLLFLRGNLNSYEFARLPGETLLGAERCLVLNFTEKQGPGALTVFEQRQAIRVPVSGEIWVRSSDYLPLRINMTAARPRGRGVRRDTSTVDYKMSAHGVLLPSTVVHRAWEDDVLVTENIFQYAPFRRFAATAEIKFTEVPAPVK